MKKTGLLIAIVLGLTILSGCGRDSTFYSSGLKSEGAIKNDLEQSDVFWGMVAPAAPGDYHLTDVSVLARFTDEEKEDVVSVSVTAQSSVATYTGVFTASYEYVEGQGFVLARIFQGDNGSYGNEEDGSKIKVGAAIYSCDDWRSMPCLVCADRLRW